jgi:glycosyltransferase involved in cell wall biosynthesis
LRALLRQGLDSHAYEIVVADDAADELTKHTVANFAASSPVRIVYMPVIGAHGPAAARNVGWRAARAEFLAFTDDDCEPEPNWLAAGLASLENGADAVAGRVIVPLPQRPTDYERDAAGLEKAEFVTANCFCRKTVLQALDGFDESFRAAWREDSDLHFSLIEEGYRVVREETAIVTHPVRPARWGIALGQQRKAFYEALLYKKHRRLYRQRIGRLPLNYYASLSALGAVAVSAAISSDATFWAGVGLYSALSAAFCVKRLGGTSRSPSHVAEMALTSILIPPLSVFWRLRGAWRFGSLPI